MRSAVVVAACALGLFAADRATAQSPAAGEARFEVASVKCSPVAV